MFDSLGNLSAIIPSFFRGTRAASKRRPSSRRDSGLVTIENLEARQLLSAANAPVDDEFVPRIINGATTSDFTAVGQLSFTPTDQAVIRSTGTLVASQWVLTSASASKGLTEAGGVATVILDGITYTVDDIVPYDKYRSNSLGDYNQDLALWHLSTAVPGSIVPLTVSATPVAKRNDVTIVGFGGGGTGTTGTDGNYGTKRVGEIRVDRVSSSQFIWKSTGSESNSVDGDRGGPILKLVGGTYQIFGVSASHTSTTSKSGDSAFNTRTDLYVGWIDNVLGRAHAPTTGIDDYVSVPDTIGTSNTTFTFTSSKTSFSANGTFNSYGDADVFKIVVPASGLITIDLQNATPTTYLLDTTLQIINSDGSTVAVTKDDVNTTNLNSQIVTTLAAGTYYVRAGVFGDAQLGSYRLNMKLKYDNGAGTPSSAASDYSAVGQLTFTPTAGTSVFSTGVLISDRWVLTTATASNGLTEAGGAATVILGGITYIVDDIVTYPKYNAASGTDYKQDIALWHLTTAVPGSITPLAVSATPVAAASTVNLAGFGGTSATGGVTTYGTRQTGTNKVDRVSAGQYSWKIDAALEMSNSAGDTGGVLLKNVNGVFQVVGLASVTGTTNNAIGQFSYNTRTDIYTGWINDTLARAHATVTTADDFINTADTVGTTNKTYTFTASKPTFEALGKFHQYGDVDVFKIVIAANGFMQMNLTNQTPTTQLLDVKLELLSSDGSTVLFTSDDNSSSDLNSKIETYLAAGTYFARVSGYANQAKGAYRLNMIHNIDPATTGNSLATAVTLTPNSIGSITKDVFISDPLDADWFKFTANQTGRFQFDFQHTAPSSFDPVIEVFTAAGVSLGRDDDAGTGLDAQLKITGFVAGTTYYVKLSGYVFSDLGSVGYGRLSIRKIPA